MNVEGVRLAGLIRDRPVFHRSNVSNNRCGIVGVEELLFLPRDGDEELTRTVGSNVQLREV